MPACSFDCKILVINWTFFLFYCFTVLKNLVLSPTRVDYCSASEVRHLHLMTILKSFYCPVAAYMYTLPLEEAIPFI